MEKIRVKAWIEKEDNAPADRISALMEEFKKAKMLSDEIVSQTQPLIDAVGKKKTEEVEKQIYAFVDRLFEWKKFREQLGCTPREIHLSVFKESPGQNHRLKIIISSENELTIYLDGYDLTNDKNPSFVYESRLDAYGVITRWNECGLLDLINKEFEKLIRVETSALINKGKDTAKLLELMETK